MFTCLADYIDFYAINRPNKDLMADDDRSLTFSQTGKEIDVIASALQKKGLKKGQRIAILAKNSVTHLTVYLACAKLGVVPVGLNYRLSPPEWNFIIKDAGIKFIFADEEFIEPLKTVSGDLPLVCIYGKVDGVTSINDFKDSSAPVLENLESIDGDDVLFQMYTSGTTGNPKGVLLSHRNVIINAYQPIFTTGYFPKDDDMALIIAPMYHAAGLISALCSVIFGSAMFIHRDYDPVRTITDIPAKKITAMTAIPVMLQFSIACVPDIKDYDFSSLRCISYGASPISVSLLKESLDIFGCDFSQAYGQTESAGCLTILTPDDHKYALEHKPELLLSCGRAMLGTELKIVDDEGNELPDGEIGEVLARGQQVMSGYWQLEKASAETLKGGWLHTGDAGYRDEDGYYYLSDRIKDIIISGGENIYPAEVENIVLSHELIADATIIGVADEKWGEVPLLVIAKNPDHAELSVEELNTYCRDKMAAYKIPKHIEYIDMLPRNPTGKILKKELREQFKAKFSA